MLPLAGQMLKLDPYRGGQHGPCLRMIYNSVKYSICYSGCDVMMCSLTLLWCAGLSRFSRVRLFVTEWTVVCQAPLSIGFPRQGLPFPAPGIFLTQGSNPCLLHLLHWQAGSLPLAPPGKPNLIVVIVSNHDVQTITLYMLKDELRHIKKLKSLLSKNRFEWSGVKSQVVRALY